MRTRESRGNTIYGFILVQLVVTNVTYVFGPSRRRATGFYVEGQIGWRRVQDRGF